MSAIKRRTGIRIVVGNFHPIAHDIQESPDAVKEAFARLQEKNFLELHSVSGEPSFTEISVFPGAVRRELSAVERKLAYYLLHYKPLDPNHPFIVSAEGICGGEPVIAGTRVSVRTIALYFLNSLGIKDIAQEIPHLTEEEILDAFHYYLDHKDDIEALMKENTLEKVH